MLNASTKTCNLIIKICVLDHKSNPKIFKTLLLKNLIPSIKPSNPFPKNELRFSAVINYKYSNNKGIFSVGSYLKPNSFMLNVFCRKKNLKEFLCLMFCFKISLLIIWNEFKEIYQNPPKIHLYTRVIMKLQGGFCIIKKKTIISFIFVYFHFRKVLSLAPKLTNNPIVKIHK
jgi:hypothetical protein